MSAEESQLEETISALKQQRDELAVQIHLGAVEAKEEFDKATERLAQLSQEYEPVKDAVAESASNIFASLQLVGNEVMESFQRIRKSLG